MYILRVFFLFLLSMNYVPFLHQTLLLTNMFNIQLFPSLISLTMVVDNSKAFAPLTTTHFSSESILNQISVSPSCKSWLFGKKGTTTVNRCKIINLEGGEGSYSHWLCKFGLWRYAKSLNKTYTIHLLPPSYNNIILKPLHHIFKTSNSNSSMQ